MPPKKFRRAFSGKRNFRPKFSSTRVNYPAALQQAVKRQEGETTNLDEKFEDITIVDGIDSRLGFYRYQEGPARLGWLINMHSTLVKDADWSGGRAAVDYYFLEENGGSFKCTLLYEPYFYIGCRPGTETEVEEYLRRKFEQVIYKVKQVEKDDLNLPNHLIGCRRTLLQLSFRNVADLLQVRKVLLPIAKANEKKMDTMDVYTEAVNSTSGINYDNYASTKRNLHDTLDNIVDIREYDIPYYLRVAIDNDIRVGYWYTVKATSGQVTLQCHTDLIKRAEPIVLAFDIETTKLPLKFPDAQLDSIMMISYMIDGQGYLITNREIVSQDIEDFEYTPKPEFEGPFIIFNEADEIALLRRFFEHIQEVKPTVFVTYNGDSFDWPFIQTRATVHGIDMYQEIGFYKDNQDEFRSKAAIHMDCFRWVKRDSYLPQGSQGLKAVTTNKLGYNPLELDPEDMTRFASEQPQTLAQYSVSDAVATYYLYMKYVHEFIFSLCNIIPLIPDEILRKGSGTLCEILLMVEAYKANIIMPNKHTDKLNNTFDGHLLESETYVGGHVEALEAGVFRRDIVTKFKIVPEAAQQLINQLDAALQFTITTMGKKSMSDIVNYDEVRNEIIRRLESLRDSPYRQETPLIYHLDVAAMYPNIILTNRLQPDALIDESTCASCDFNLPGKTCDRRMNWSWRGEYFPAKRNEIRMIRNQLNLENFPAKKPGGVDRQWDALSEIEQSTLLQKRVIEYSRRVYKKVHETKVVERESIVCQRENSFYINTVKAFRDRRYEHKDSHKKWKSKQEQATDVPTLDECKKMVVLYDSLQLAHKVILNSFYGYVMRKGARWYSMEMAGIVCLTGAKIIQLARQLVEQVGRPLELDTDGIWCIFPSTFPENFSFELSDGKKLEISYPCTMLNHLVYDKFTNHQYQDLVNPETHEYATHSENSIFFEVDGPYRAMILPSSKEEDKLLKKRYVVFNNDGTTAELKGFELKRRGELKLIKIFQTQIFKVFLEGTTLEECYAAVAKVADGWLDVLYSRAIDLDDDELVDLISENRSMSRSLEDYGTQKSTSISTAKRLAEFLGDQMVKDKGLACKFIISSKPAGASITERAIPIAIFSAEPGVKKYFLRKWLKDNSLTTFDLRDILDWPYYLERIGSVIQKLITIPAASQGVANPVPRIRHPDWLFKRVAQKDDKFKQHRITEMFSKIPGNAPLSTGNSEDMSIDENQGDGNTRNILNSSNGDMLDIEDFGSNPVSKEIFKTGCIVPVVRKAIKDTIGNNVNELLEKIPEKDLPENMPDMFGNYGDWLGYQKRKWKLQRQERKKRRENARDASTVHRMFTKQTGSLITRPWQILQIAETDIPGEFKMFVLIHQQLYTIRLTVPRIVYVNSREEKSISTNDLRQSAACRIEKRIRTLPRSHPSFNLFQLTMPEAIYQSEQKKFASFFSHSSTEGIYETQIPLLMRALLTLGSVCKVDAENNPTTAFLGLKDRFNLQDLTTDELNAPLYMEHLHILNYIYLYHSTSDSRHFISLIPTASDKAFIFVVGAGSNGSDHMPNMSKMYHERLQEFLKTEDAQTLNGAFSYKDAVDFDVGYYRNEREAFRAVGKALSAYQNHKHGPTVIVLQSPKTFSNLTQHTSIFNDFPYVSMPAHKSDSMFPALDWQRHAARRMVAHYLQIGSWVLERIMMARYANVPFGNIQNDSPIFLVDIFFARRLIKHDMILWWSSYAKPDLGRREEDENLSVIDDLINPEDNEPGSYNTLCLEVDVMKLCVNALLEANLINELEGTSGGLGFDVPSLTLEDHYKLNSTTSFGEGTISAKTFAIFRSMVQGWFAEAIRTNNKYAELMIEHLQRWLTSSSANMYDPCLWSIVHMLMKKVFMRLKAEFREIGSKVIFANFNKIIIATPKESIANAYAYVSTNLKGIMQKPLFSTLEIVPVQYWEQLLWMDSANYGGIIYKDSVNMIAAINEENKESSESKQQSVDMRWNIKEYLPIALQSNFQMLIAQFIYGRFKYRMEKRQANNNDTLIKNRLSGINSHDESQYAKILVSQNLNRRLLSLIPEILKFQSEATVDGDISTWVFPQLAGSHLDLRNPALEFIKSICAVLALDSDLESEIRILKRDCLRLIGVREFADEAQFRNPCESFRLTQVICNYCNFCRDLDFCRDPDLMPVSGKVRTWRCPGCTMEYDKSFIEETLIEEVQRRAMAYQLQDLHCRKCWQVKRENLLRQCGCSGTYATMQSKTEFVRKMRIFANVAREQQFGFLKEVVEWVLKRS